MRHPARLKLSLGSLLVLTTIAAICCAACMTPSPYTAGVMLVMTVFILVFAVQRAYYSVERRAFWLSFLVGVAVLYVFNMRNRETIAGQFFQNVVVDPIWSQMQAEYGRLNYSDAYESLYRSLHLTVALAFPAVAAFVMQFVARERREE